MKKIFDKICHFILIQLLRLELYSAIKAIGLSEFEEILIQRGWTKLDLVDRRVYMKKDAKFTITDATPGEKVRRRDAFKERK